jgi:LysM repeat protein
LIMILGGCQRQEPQIETPVLTQTISAQRPAATDVQTQPSQVGQSPGGETPVAGNQDTLTGQAPGAVPVVTETLTPAPCEVPEGWIEYTIQPGDTLFSLANWTESEVEELVRVNCLEGNLIIAGERIYLPSRPQRPVASSQGQALPQPPRPRPQPPAAECSTPFSCPNPKISQVTISPGGPNQDLIPCTETVSPPWISYYGRANAPLTYEIGQHVFFFACQFQQPETLSAEVSGPGGKITLEVLESIPNPFLEMEPAQRVFAFDAICTLPPGKYTLTVRAAASESAQVTFFLADPTVERILVVPQSTEAGGAFDIWYCGYGDVAREKILVDFFYETVRQGKESQYTHYTDWFVEINSSGWATQELASSAGDQARGYLIMDHDPGLKGEDYFWLTH